MPKKFKGENTKAQDARARKAAVREAVEERRKQEEEGAAWRDDDKHVARKQERKVCLHAWCCIVYYMSMHKTPVQESSVVRVVLAQYT